MAHKRPLPTYEGGRHHKLYHVVRDLGISMKVALALCRAAEIPLIEILGLRGLRIRVAHGRLPDAALVGREVAPARRRPKLRAVVGGRREG